MSEDDSLKETIETLVDQAALECGQSPLYGAVIPFITQQMILSYLERQEEKRWRKIREGVSGET